MSEALRIPELNKTIVIGRVTRDLELRYTPSNQAVTSFSVAVNRNYKDSQTGEWKEQVSFVPVVSWGKQAEIAAERLKKGSAVYVEGRLQSRSWESKQGEKRSTIEVIADRLQFLTKQEIVAEGTPTAVEETKTKKSKVETSEKNSKEAWDEDIANVDEEIPF